LPDEILIAGSSGFLGRHLAQQLMSRGFSISVENQSASGDQKKADLRNFNETLELLQRTKPGVVINCVGVTPQRNTSRLYDLTTNFEISKNLIEATKVVGGVRQFISIGSASEFGFGDSPASESDFEVRLPDSEYGLDKRSSTTYLLEQRQGGLSVVIVRPTTIYGAGQTSNMLIAQLLSAVRSDCGPVSIQNPDDVRDYLHVNDFVAAVERILLCKHEPLSGHFNIGSGHTLKAREVAELIARLTGIELAGIANFSETITSGVGQTLTLSTQLFSRTFGWTPKISLVEGLRKEIEASLQGPVR
jgi:UDP-glucose 4-epimerase